MALTGAQVVILYFCWDKIQLHRPIYMLYDSSNDYRLRISLQSGHIASIGFRNDYNVKPIIHDATLLHAIVASCMIHYCMQQNRMQHCCMQFYRIVYVEMLHAT